MYPVNGAGKEEDEVILGSNGMTGQTQKTRRETQANTKSQQTAISRGCGTANSSSQTGGRSLGQVEVTCGKPSKGMEKVVLEVTTGQQAYPVLESGVSFGGHLHTKDHFALNKLSKYTN